MKEAQQTPRADSASSGQKMRPIASSERLLRIALIGCGGIAESYYMPALARHPTVLESLILVDRDKDRAQRMAARFHVKRWLADYHEALDEVDGVIIALPTHLHYPVSMEFLSRGVHVLCEKPLAECADKAKQMVAQANASKAVLAVDYLQRLWPQFAKVKELIADRSMGEPVDIKYSVGEVFDWPTVSGFYFNAAGSAGILRDRGAHVFDHICWWFGGKPGLVSSQNDSFGGAEAVARVRFELGKCVGDVRLSWLGNSPCRFTVRCEAGIIAGDIYDFRAIRLKTGSAEDKLVTIKSAVKSKADVGFKVVTNFMNVIAKRESPLIPGSDVLDSIQFIDECYKAATRLEMPWYERVLEVQGVS